MSEPVNIESLRVTAEWLRKVEQRAMAYIVEGASAEIERLRAEFEDACKVFEHYDLPEHAFHYRRKLGLQQKASVSGETK